ncbi:mercuric transporter MerT family protein [uncultured Flavobacterium sp.]|uniref:mercuric transporter MerT family protein n=1 Tax=uncultured Flavobacterium sp. TaxID=165435 RepID=UPI0025E867D0|nr:mercuric transporter MerT family protein [uncultured Flavobacterium sp.]
MKSSTNKTISAGSGILAALLASTCCISPLLSLAGAIGVSVAQLSWLISIKPYLIAVSLLAVAYNLYLAYKPRKQVCCTQEGPGSNAGIGKNGFRSKGFLWAIVILTLLLLLLPYASQAKNLEMPKGQVQSFTLLQEKERVAKSVFKVEKMTQSCCVGIIEYSLKDIEGYIKCEADVKARKLTVFYDANKTTKKKVLEAINKTPYKASEIKASNG